MKTITDIKPQTNNSKRVSVYLDGNFYCGLDLITATKNRLKIGQKITETELVKIQREGELQKAYDYSLNYITKSVKTEKQIANKLRLKGYLEEIISEVVLKLKSYNFINDDDYAKRYINTYKDKKGLKLIKLELIKKGVNKEVIESNLEVINNQIDRAKAIAEKYVKGKEKDRKTYAKCYNYLLSKGFSYDDCDIATKFVFEDIEN